MEEDKSGQLKRIHEFDDVYANNTHFEPSVWDLKIIYGQLDQSSGGVDIDWHTAVTMPWPAAKIASYYLQANLILHEARSGPIKIPPEVLPAPPAPPTEETKDDPVVIAVYERFKKAYDELFGGNE